MHGLGFANVLREIGLPQTELATGLIFFNIGVEIGQLIFVCGALLLVVLARRIWLSRVGATTRQASNATRDGAAQVGVSDGPETQIGDCTGAVAQRPELARHLMREDIEFDFLFSGKLGRIAPYCVGILACFWLVERMATFR